MSRPVSAVLFDLGDTLWHFPKMPPVQLIRGETVRRISRFLKENGFEDTDGRRMLGRDIRWEIEAATDRAFHGDCIDPGYPDLCRRVAARHGMELAPEQSEELWEVWNLGGPFFGRALFPDVLETLNLLKERGYRLGSVTNRGYGGPVFKQEMRDLGLAGLFEVVAVSCDVGYMKPRPELYQYALERMAIQPEETVMVGDSLRADVAGSKALGMIAVWRKPPLAEPVEETTDKPEAEGPVLPDYTIDSIGELARLPILRERDPGR
jgi:HAD superfamily hydrolase (TIGR01662 family)